MYIYTSSASISPPRVKKYSDFYQCYCYSWTSKKNHSLFSLTSCFFQSIGLRFTHMVGCSNGSSFEFLCSIPLYEYIIIFIYPTVNRHMSCFLLLGAKVYTIMNKALLTFLYLSFGGHMHVFPLSIHLGVELDNFTGFCRYCQFFKVIPLYISTSNQWSSVHYHSWYMYQEFFKSKTFYSCAMESSL